MKTLLRDVVKLAAEMREVKVRNRSGGFRRRSWQWIADELRRRGLGSWGGSELARAVAAIPIADHPLAPMSKAGRQLIEESFEKAWAENFPDEPYPGFKGALERLRLSLASMVGLP